MKLFKYNVRKTINKVTKIHWEFVNHVMLYEYIGLSH